MFEFSKLCKEFEARTALERGVIMTGKSAEIFAKLRKLNVPGVDPVQTLAGFILGSVVADGRVNEQEYLLIYPALIHTFGDDFDFESIKQSFKDDRDGRNAVKEYTQEMLSLISRADESLIEDVVLLCFFLDFSEYCGIINKTKHGKIRCPEANDDLQKRIQGIFSHGGVFRCADGRSHRAYENERRGRAYCGSVLRSRLYASDAFVCEGSGKELRENARGTVKVEKNYL